MNSLPRLLIIEDEPLHLRNLEERFSSPPRAYEDTYGLPAFKVDTAATGAEALQLLGKAAAETRQYDVVILDLGLPSVNPSDGADKQTGHGILESVHRENQDGCTAVIIHSVYSEVASVLHLLRTGAADFVPKPCREEAIVQSVARAYKVARARQHGRWLTYCQRRLEHWLLIQACSEVADGMRRLVSDGLSKVLLQVHELITLMRQRYQLNLEYDAHEPVCKALKALREGVISTKRDCANNQYAARANSGPRERMLIKSVLDSAVDKLRPGFVYRRICLERSTSQHSVHTFRADLENIVQEMMFSAIESSEEGAAVTCTVEWGSNGLTADIGIADQAVPLEQSVCDRIAQGEVLDQTVGRGWGLSLAQRLAHNMGARIEIKATTSGNTVILRIPVTADDQRTGPQR
jgi:CheY-like chemotaxis protein